MRCFTGHNLIRCALISVYNRTEIETVYCDKSVTINNLRLYIKHSGFEAAYAKPSENGFAVRKIKLKIILDKRVIL